MNNIQSNYPAIDLGDTNEGVCVQITAERGSSKIKKTIKKFNEKELYKEYRRLVFFILTDKKSYSSNFDTQEKFEFSKVHDIWDMDDVLEVVETFDLEKLQAIHSFLKKELSSIVGLLADRESLLSQIEDISGVSPKDSSGFLKHLEFDKDDIEQGQEDILELYKKISSLSKRSREYLYVLLTRTTIESMGSDEVLFAFPVDIENHLRISRAEGQEEFQILEAKNMVDYDVDDYPPRIKIFHPIRVGGDMFLMLKEYLDEDQFKSLIINCDFSCLDT